jgi:hypothetical protein
MPVPAWSATVFTARAFQDLRTMANAISDTAYVDQTVQSGNKYYVVTAVNDRGQESTFSTQTSVTIP